MIGYLNGKVKFLTEDECILDVNGVGYRVSVDSMTRQDLKVDSAAEFFIHTSVREDAINLFGFKNRLRWELFQKFLRLTLRLPSPIKIYRL